MSDTLYYAEAGSGKPLILLHGNGEDHGYFVHQIEYFSKYFHIYALDTRGHGRSPRGEGPFTIARFAEDLHTFMEERKLPKANLLGFSDGANIALSFALRYPEQIDRLILNGANLDAGGVKPSTQIPIVIGYKIASLFSGKSEGARRNAEMLRLMVDDPNIAPEELEKIIARTLVIAGTRDMIRKEHTRLIAEKIPHAELVFIEGDHFIANKKWAEFNAVVKRFFTDESCA